MSDLDIARIANAKNLLKDIMEIDPRKAARLAMQIIETMFDNKDFKTVDWLLANIEPNLASPYVVIGVLRCSYRAHQLHDIRGWVQAVNRCYEVFVNRGIPDIKGLFAGMHD